MRTPARSCPHGQRPSRPEPLCLRRRPRFGYAGGEVADTSPSPWLGVPAHPPHRPPRIAADAGGTDVSGDAHPRRCHGPHRCPARRRSARDPPVSRAVLGLMVGELAERWRSQPRSPRPSERDGLGAALRAAKPSIGSWFAGPRPGSSPRCRTACRIPQVDRGHAGSLRRWWSDCACLAEIGPGLRG